jgi:hypothetical protein
VGCETWADLVRGDAGGGGWGGRTGRTRGRGGLTDGGQTHGERRINFLSYFQ